MKTFSFIACVILAASPKHVDGASCCGASNVDNCIDGESARVVDSKVESVSDDSEASGVDPAPSVVDPVSPHDVPKKQEKRKKRRSTTNPWMKLHPEGTEIERINGNDYFIEEPAWEHYAALQGARTNYLRYDGLYHALEDGEHVLLRESNVVGDGICLFHTLKNQFEKTNDWAGGATLRSELVNYVADHWDFDVPVPATPEEVLMYKKDFLFKKTPGYDHVVPLNQSWGSDFEISAFAKWHKVKIIVYHREIKENKSPKFLRPGVYGPETGAVDTLRILYHDYVGSPGANHFSELRKVYDTDCGSVQPHEIISVQFAEGETMRQIYRIPEEFKKVSFDLWQRCARNEAEKLKLTSISPPEKSTANGAAVNGREGVARRRDNYPKDLSRKLFHSPELPGSRLRGSQHRKQEACDDCTTGATGEACPICMEDILKSDLDAGKILTAKCCKNTSFHKSCIENQERVWRENNRVGRDHPVPCPICRENFRTGEKGEVVANKMLESHPRISRGVSEEERLARRERRRREIEPKISLSAVLAASRMRRGMA